jgi:hypothetical protein
MKFISETKPNSNTIHHTVQNVFLPSSPVTIAGVINGEVCVKRHTVPNSSNFILHPSIAPSLQRDLVIESTITYKESHLCLEDSYCTQIHSKHAVLLYPPILRKKHFRLYVLFITSNRCIKNSETA